MNISFMVKEKKDWKNHIKRVKKLPKDYQIVYFEIQKYIFKTGDLKTNYKNIFEEIINIFEEGVLNKKYVLDITGKDVAYFCDELIKL